MSLLWVGVLILACIFLAAAMPPMWVLRWRREDRCQHCGQFGRVRSVNRQVIYADEIGQHWFCAACAWVLSRPRLEVHCYLNELESSIAVHREEQ